MTVCFLMALAARVGRGSSTVYPTAPRADPAEHSNVCTSHCNRVQPHYGSHFGVRKVGCFYSAAFGLLQIADREDEYNRGLVRILNQNAHRDGLQLTITECPKNLSRTEKGSY